MKYPFIIVVFLVLWQVFSSCSPASKVYSSKRIVSDKQEQQLAFCTEYPELSTHLDEGLVNIYRVTEFVRPGGSRYYKIRFGFTRRFITDYGERMAVLKAQFPEVYQMFSNGAVIVNNLYEYVDRDQHIKYHIDYRYVSDRRLVGLETLFLLNLLNK